MGLLPVCGIQAEVAVVYFLVFFAAWIGVIALRGRPNSIAA